MKTTYYLAYISLPQLAKINWSEVTSGWVAPNLLIPNSHLFLSQKRYNLLPICPIIINILNLSGANQPPIISQPTNSLLGFLLVATGLIFS